MFQLWTGEGCLHLLISKWHWLQKPKFQLWIGGLSLSWWEHFMQLLWSLYKNDHYMFQLWTGEGCLHLLISKWHWLQKPKFQLWIGGLSLSWWEHLLHLLQSLYKNDHYTSVMPLHAEVKRDIDGIIKDVKVRPKSEWLQTKLTENKQKQKCKHCESIHEPRQYTAYSKTCTICSKLNHFKNECKSIQIQNSRQFNKSTRGWAIHAMHHKYFFTGKG